MKYYNRSTQKVEETVEYQQKTLEFLYHTVLGRVLLKLIVARPWFSRLRGIYQSSGASKKDIRPFAEKHHIELDDGQLNSFASFNDFFTRKKQVVTDNTPNGLVSIADSKMRYYKITDQLRLPIKHSVYDIADIVGDKEIAEHFRNGTCIVFRLSVDDCHRYHYIDSGRLIAHRKIKGMLHTVRPISEKYAVFARNTREVSLLDTERLGKVAQIEIGALLVGKIVNHGVTEFTKMQEKGYFEYGGSTVVLLLSKAVRFDEDIVRMNAAGIETQVHAGERIGII